MRAAASELARRLRDVPWTLPHIPVFSPILGRYYGPDDNVPECLALQLTRRVRFAEAVHQLANTGVGSFVECGPLTGLGRFVERAAAPAAFTDGDPTRVMHLVGAPWAQHEVSGSGASCS
jgi:malonyl CoA-acyl carrier protein transacylase